MFVREKVVWFVEKQEECKVTESDMRSPKVGFYASLRKRDVALKINSKSHRPVNSDKLQELLGMVFSNAGRG